MKSYSYVVEGSGPFPLDMLRYDESFPASELDAGIILDRGRREIMLRSYSEPQPARWSSFGWTVKGYRFSAE